MKISVILLSYNHAKYLNEAIESILMQQVENYELEIIVADDFSKDNSLKIIHDYQKKFPNLIKILETNKNYGITKNYQRAFKECSGDYIAILEGDDYWTSPLKLIRQANLLTEHKEYSFCFHRFIAFDQQNKDFFVSNKINKEKEIITARDLILDNFIGNFSTCMYRKKIVDQLPESLYEMEIYDWMFNIVNSEFGVIGYLPEFMSIYRLHQKGVWTSKTQEDKKLMLINSIEQYDQFLNYKYTKEFNCVKPIFIKHHSFNSTKLLIRILEMITPKIVILFLEWILPPFLISFIKRR